MKFSGYNWLWCFIEWLLFVVLAQIWQTFFVWPSIPSEIIALRYPHFLWSVWSKNDYAYDCGHDFCFCCNKKFKTADKTPTWQHFMTELKARWKNLANLISWAKKAHDYRLIMPEPFNYIFSCLCYFLIGTK